MFLIWSGSYAAIAECALNHGRTPVISAAFESSISLSAYAQFATYIDSRCQQTNNSRTLGSDQDGQHVPVLAHGLGTYTWLDGDVVKSENRFRVIDNRDGSITSEMVDLAILQPELDEDYISSKDKQMRMKNFSVSVENGANIHRFHVWDTGRNSQAGSNEVPTLVFLHGFMGSGREWLPFMEALAPAFRCITFDLPGHGLTTVEEETASRDDHNLDHHGLEKTNFTELMLRTSCRISTAPFSMESVSVVLVKLLKQLEVGKFVPVGYSMGARIALYLALHHSDQVAAVISIAGSPGLEDSSARKSRAASDESLAETLRAGGLELFVESWYQQPLWASLRKHPNFEAIKVERKQHTNCEALADLLASLSVGHQPSLWDKLSNITIPALLIAGDQDTKFLKLAHKMCGRSHQRAGKVTQRSRKAVRSVGREERWVSSQGFQIPLEFTSALPQATNEFPNLVVIPKDVSLEDFFAEEMKKIRLADDKETISDVNNNNKKKAPDLEVEEGTDGTDGFFRVVKIENSGHAVHLENPLSLLGILRTFLQTSKGSIS
jgi:isochorismate synthase/2-succinyl-5-enolpyruvyl-6-hydroxy-3-cyclohexene-1-carboxylate synthase/2-succinyl-6-hydroxy-2,4-cyclohexadiene-1-carboxylate synthase/O-succinylbenzoate synthase